jgi:predicted GNAT family N-acyltransferase
VPYLDPPQGYRVERLDTERHSREGFSCGEEALDQFLLQKAAQNQEKAQSSTHVVLEGDGASIVGYVTLINARIPLTDLPATSKKLTNRDDIPAMLIARMAVDRRCQGKRIGEFLLKHALKLSFESSRIGSCSAVFLDAKDKSKQFYLKYGFTELPGRPSRLYIPIATVAKLFLS